MNKVYNEFVSSLTKANWGDAHDRLNRIRCVAYIVQLRDMSIIIKATPGYFDACLVSHQISPFIYRIFSIKRLGVKTWPGGSASN